eukprot:Skav221330  [mRNA]  locus=scaffold1234:3115:4311:+ [translate_table: standard]
MSDILTLAAPGRYAKEISGFRSGPSDTIVFRNTVAALESLRQQLKVGEMGPKTLPELNQISAEEQRIIWQDAVRYEVSMELREEKLREDKARSLPLLDRMVGDVEERNDGLRERYENLCTDRDNLAQIPIAQSLETLDKDLKAWRQRVLADQVLRIRNEIRDVEKQQIVEAWNLEHTRAAIREQTFLLIIAENEQKSDRIPFDGSTAQAFQEGETAIVSFPGVHGYGWQKLTEISQRVKSPVVTSCVFLPDAKAPGYGEHQKILGGDCYCMNLYGEQKEWGCMWFSTWREQTFRAHKNRCKLVVVTKKDGSLGESQEGEVRFLDQEPMPHEKITIERFAEMILGKEE